MTSGLSEPSTLLETKSASLANRRASSGDSLPKIPSAIVTSSAFSNNARSKEATLVAVSASSTASSELVSASAVFAATPSLAS